MAPSSSHQDSWGSWILISLKISVTGVDPYPSCWADSMGNFFLRDQWNMEQMAIAVVLLKCLTPQQAVSVVLVKYTTLWINRKHQSTTIDELVVYSHSLCSKSPCLSAAFP